MVHGSLRSRNTLLLLFLEREDDYTPAVSAAPTLREAEPRGSGGVPPEAYVSIARVVHFLFARENYAFLLLFLEKEDDYTPAVSGNPNLRGGCGRGEAPEGYVSEEACVWDILLNKS
jgi:hypothetical protein